MRRTPSQIHDPARLAAVRDTGLLDTPPDEGLGRLATLAATLLDAPFGFITLVDDQRSFWRAAIGLPEDAPRQNSVEESFCQYVIANPGLLLIDDAAADPLTCDNPSIAGMGVGAWAGTTLRSPAGDALGSFCVVDTQPRAWTERDAEVLQTLAEAASVQIARNIAEHHRQLLVEERERLVTRIEDQRALLADVVNRAGAGVILWEGRDLRCQLINETGRALLPERRPLIGVPYLDVFPEARGFIESTVLPIFDSGQDVTVRDVGISYTGIAATGDRRFYDVSLSPIWQRAWSKGSWRRSPRRHIAVQARRSIQVELDEVRDVTEDLQTALLPRKLAEVPGVRSAARYRAADRRATVGGDFYDLFAAADGAFIAVVGDVCGKGPRAAATTGMARWTLRSAARTTSQPAALLAHLCDVVTQSTLLESGEFITLVLVRLEPTPDGVRLTSAHAGHPPGVVSRSDGTAALLTGTGGLVRPGVHPTFSTSHAHLRRGDTLVLFSDGLLDAQAPDRQLHAEDLAAHVRPGDTPDRVADTLMQLTAGPRPIRDDIAILVLTT